MSGELRTSVVMDLRGNLERQARRYEGSLKQLSTSGQRYMGRLSRAAGALGRGLDSMGNQWTALATGVAGIGTVRSLVALEERFTRLGIAAGKSEEDMDALRETIFDISRQPDIRVDPSQVTSAIEAILEKTGDLEFAENNLRNIAAAISATGAEGSAIGDILAEFQKMDIKKPEAVLKAIDTLNEQGKSGAFTLAELANLGPRVVTAYTALGRTGPQAIREMGAALQLIVQGSGSSEQAATAFEALLRTLQQADKIKMLQAGGIKLYDPEELERGNQVLRPINELIVEIVEAVDGRGSLLSKVFDAEAMRAFNTALTEYNLNGEITSLRKFMSVQADGTATMEDSARAADTAAGAWRNISSAWQQFADNNLSGPIQAAADALNSLDQETVDRWLKIGGMAAAGLGGLYALRSLGKLGADLGRGARSIWRGASKGKGGIAGELGGAASKMAPVPVFVTNMGAMGGGASGRKGAGYTSPSTRSGSSPRPGGRSPAPKVRLTTKAIRGATALARGPLLPVAAAASAGWTTGTMINDALDRTETGRRIGDEIGEAVARVLAAFGNDQAQRALRINEGGESSVVIKVDQDGRVRDVRPERGPGGPEIDVDVGDWRAWR